MKNRKYLTTRYVIEKRQDPEEGDDYLALIVFFKEYDSEYIFKTIDELSEKLPGILVMPMIEKPINKTGY